MKSPIYEDVYIYVCVDIYICIYIYNDVYIINVSANRFQTSRKTLCLEVQEKEEREGEGEAEEMKEETPPPKRAIFLFHSLTRASPY